MNRGPITCGWCNQRLPPGTPRMRLHETPDSSVRTTQMVMSFHPACGRALVEHLASRSEIAVAIDDRRQAWAHGPAIGRMQ
jgi:hypothetical protein